MRASASALSLVSFAAALAAVTAYAPPSEACLAPLPPYVTLDRVLPAAGSKDVALDAAVLVDATGWNGSSQSDATNTLPSLLLVTVTPRGSTVPVPGAVVGWTDGRAIFQPTTPLAPSTTYDVSASVKNTEPAPPGNGGLTTSSSNFTTGTSASAPLSFGGDPTFRFEDLDHEVCAPDAFGGCGTCSPMVEKRDRFVVIVLPPPAGGDAIGGFEYSAKVTLDQANAPDGAAVAAKTAVQTREPARLPVPLVAATRKDGVCVELTLQDVTQKPVRRARQCFAKEEVWPEETSAAGGAGGAGGAASAGGAGAGGSAIDESGPPSQDPGCSIVRPTQGEARTPIIAGALLTTLALGVSLRRRRRAATGA